MAPPPTWRERPLESSIRTLPTRTSSRARRRRTMAVAATVLVALAIVGLYGYFTYLRPPTAPSGPKNVSVTLGAPTVSKVACAGNQSMYGERVPWVSSSGPVTTANFSLRIVDITGGESIGGNNPPGAVSPSNLCVGGALPAAQDWYAVVVAANGTNVATFSYVYGWQPIPPGSLPVTMGPGFTVVLVGPTDFVGHGYSLDVIPAVDGPGVSGITAL